MKKLSILFLAIAVGATLMLVYVSILGENAKIDRTVDKFFQAIQQENYQEISKYYKQTEPSSADRKEKYLPHAIIALEISLLSHFDLLNESKYIAEIKQQELWLPFLHKGPVHLNVRLQPKSNGIWNLFAKTKDDILEDFLTVERQEGSWIITQIDWDNPYIAKKFDTIYNKMKFLDLVELDEQTLSFKGVELKRASLTPEDARMLIFYLNSFKAVVNNTALGNSH